MPVKPAPDHYGLRVARGPRPRTAKVARTLKSGGPHNTLHRNAQVGLLEYQDTFFHDDSAVMMPDAASDAAAPDQAQVVFDADFRQDLERSHPGSYDDFAGAAYDPPDDGEARVSGLGAIAACYRFLKTNESYGLLVAGHTDTKGRDDYNFGLSKLRAQNVIHLLLGERDAWIEVCRQKSRVEDRQRILKHVTRAFAWPCDPGPVDGADGPRTRAALRSFQSQYNLEFDASIHVDGVIGSETWGAFFDVYMKELATLLGTDANGLAGARVVRFVDDDNHFIACGEKMPIDAAGRDDYRSQANRRVELLYFPLASPPDLSCHAGTKPFCMKSCDRSACGVYAPNLYEFVYIDPNLTDADITNKTTEGQYAMTTQSDDLSAVLAQEDLQPLELELHGPTGDGGDAWAFLEAFEETEPADGTRESPSRDAGGGRIA